MAYDHTVLRCMSVELFLCFEVSLPHIVTKIMQEVTVEFGEGCSFFITPAFVEVEFCILLFIPQG